MPGCACGSTPVTHKLDLEGPPPGWERYTIRDDDGVLHEAVHVRRHRSTAEVDDAWEAYSIEGNAIRRECADVLRSAGYDDAAEILDGIADELEGKQ